MKNKNLTGYLVDVCDELAGSITISNTLDALYDILNCDLIDITTRNSLLGSPISAKAILNRRCHPPESLFAFLFITVLSESFSTTYLIFSRVLFFEKP